MSDSEPPESATLGEPPEPRASAVPKAKTPMTAKQMGTYIVGAAAVVAALAGLGSQVGSWLRWGLGIDTMQQTIEDQDEQIDELKQRLGVREQIPDANHRLDQALPRIAMALRSSNKDVRTVRHATARLATIHEFSLDRRRAREAAQQVQERLRSAVDEGDESDVADSALDALEGL